MVQDEESPEAPEELITYLPSLAVIANREFETHSGRK